MGCTVWQESNLERELKLVCRCLYSLNRTFFFGYNKLNFGNLNQFTVFVLELNLIFVWCLVDMLRNSCYEKSLNFDTSCEVAT